MWYIYAMEYYLAIKRNEVHSTTWLIDKHRRYFTKMPVTKTYILQLHLYGKHRTSKLIATESS